MVYIFFKMEIRTDGFLLFCEASIWPDGELCNIEMEMGNVWRAQAKETPKFSFF